MRFIKLLFEKLRIGERLNSEDVRPVGMKSTVVLFIGLNLCLVKVKSFNSKFYILFM